MNAYIAEQIARQRTEDLYLAAATARRVRQTRKTRRGGASFGPAETTERAAGTQAPRHAAAANFVTRPFTAFHSWLVAGQL